MEKTDLLELEANSHLSIDELREKLPRLAGQLDERLERRAHRKAAARLAGGSEKLRELVERVRIPVGREPGRRGLRAAAIEALRDAAGRDPRLAGDAALKEELDALERSAAAPVAPGARPEPTLAESLRLDEPIAFHPELRPEIEAAKVFRLSDAAGLADRTAKVLVDEIGRPADITERRLEALVAEQKLTAGEARAAGAAASLYHVLDERPELVAAARTGIGDVRELVELDRAAWQKLIEDSKTRPPGDLSAEAYAELLEKKVKRLFPTDALASRLAQLRVPEALAREPELLARRYPGMRLAEVLGDRARPAAERSAEVVRRTGLVNRFFADNQDVLGADLTPRSGEVKGLSFGAGASDADKAMVLATARTYQRAFAVTDDITDAEALVAGGFRSAVSVAMSRPAAIAASTGLAPEVAARYHEKARGIATAVTAHAGTVIDLLGDTFTGTLAGNVSTEIGGYLKEIPGFADFFGNQGFCDCRHCQSILGPAAYFVDLMTFVDENITQEVFADKPAHPLKLENRRPDLWTLELTCEHTSTQIPYLVIINEILENAVARDVGFAGDLGDRAAVLAAVYRDTLPDQVDSFEQPFHLPFEELRIYLRHFDRSLADLADAGQAADDALARLRLGLPPRDFELITQPRTALPFLRRVYGVPFAEAGGAIAGLDAQLLLDPMGVSRHELGELIATRYVTGDGAVNIQIVGEKRSAESVQNDVENITGLTRAALDRMHRFVRLLRATGWRIGELDLVLTHLAAAGLGGALDAATVRAVAAVHRLQTTREVSVEELIALWSVVPRHPVLRAVPLFDRLFNQPSFVLADGTYPKPGTTFLHPALASAPPAATDPDLHRLLAGTHTTEDELLQLILGLAGPLGIDPGSAADADKAFALDERNLALLYRHARLARLLRVTVPELFALAALAPELGADHVEDLGDLEALLAFHAWTRTTRWTPAELVRILRPALVPQLELPQPARPDAAALAAALVAQVADAEALIFADTVFALLPPRGAEITEAQSREIVAANAALFETVDAQGRHRLRPGFDPGAPLALPPSVDASLEPALRDLLAGYHGAHQLLALLPGRVDVHPAALPALVAMLGADLDADAYFRELRGDVPPQAIAQLIDDLRPLAVLYEDEAVFDAAHLDFIAGERALFEIGDFRALSAEAVRNVELFRALLAAWVGRPEPAPDLPALLRAFTPAARFAAADQEQLAALLGTDLALLQSLQAHLPLGARPFDVLRQLVRAVAFARHVGVGGAALAHAQRAAYADLAAASAAVQAAFRAKYPEEREWEAKVQPFRDDVLSRRRDGLVAYLVHSGPDRFDEVSDLYHHFLLDVELEGCARTSRVAAAIDSVQLYVHRCLLNLEETRPGDPDPVHVLPERVPPEEWDWRKSYRVWEANRKIFLYPEDYLEPELRDDKTPLFRQLEEELLSKEITDEAILEAYARYLRGFDELAHLTIAGSYHEKDEEARHDALHLFGVTADEPPTYYYRRVEDAHFGATGDDRATHWGPWEKMDAQVPVRKLSPIVHRGQLYALWNRYTTKPRNEVRDGTNRFVGYEHRGYVELCKRRLDGSWTTPQAIRLAQSPFAEAFFPSWYRENGAIGDPIVPKADTLIGFQVEANILGLRLSFVADPSGHATVHVFGVKVEVQLPASAMNATAPTTVTIGGNEYTVTPIRQATLHAPLYDSQPHAEPKEGYTLRGFGWDRLYPATGTALSLRGFNFQMWSPVDLYRLEIGARYEYQDPYDTGVPWIHPGAFALLLILAILFGWDIDFDEMLADRLIWSRAAGERRELHATASVFPCFDGYTFAAVLLDEANVARYAGRMALSTPEWNRPQWSEEVTDYLFSLLRERRIADAPGDATLEVVNGSIGDVVIQTSRDAFYLQSEIRDDGRYHLRRLNTSLSEDIADVLFGRGLDELLATETQLGLAEHPTGLNLVAGEVHDDTGTGAVDFTGSMGTYLREVFFHIPFLIADHLNSQGRFEEAQRWYHYIFDPTATETITGLPPGLPEEERRRRELDRNWRYREFRGLTLESLRAQLTNARAIEAYRRDPFNPHAVARLRLGAYQKAVIMKYVDNLLDWGDDLFVRAFAQLNQEDLREATLKYVTAQEILGARPAQLGDCGEGRLAPKVFPRIRDALAEGSEFLMEMESVIVSRRRASSRLDPARLLPVSAERAGRELAVGYDRMARAPAPIAARPEAVREAAANLTMADVAIARRKARPGSVSVRDVSIGILDPEVTWVPDWGISLARQVSPIFCVPGNLRMLARWDRVEDRLYKLRHCLDLEGTPRQLPLFAPPIDPGLLVAGRAAGLSLDDILAAAAGSLPPYRFRYLIEKAKAYAATLQAFGAALLAALEKRDAEELARLRNTHQRNILALTTEVKRNELRVAEEGVELATRRRDAAQYRRDYYDDLISTGLTPAEITQTAARVLATVASATRLGLATAAGVAHLLPQVGSPFAMKYGGKETGDSLRTFATVAGVVGSVSEMVATISGIVAGFERREQGWEHQRRLAEHDVRTIEKEVAVAELRRAIASRGLELHDKAKEQHDEVIDFFEDKFSNLGLYTYLSRTLQQLHRTAYDNALAIARLAEQAFRFERPGDRTSFVGGEWDASRSGLLAGERLNLALQRMERRFLETNARSAEINQSFSLMQLDPQALIELKETGRCELALPELFFDMFYPGQYRRRIKAVRLTIPCITGPYTNVGAKLTLLRSHIRRDAALGAASLFEVPPGGSTSVATSTAQGDAGVFELSFRDERYMPFEGAGAISEWRLELPSQLRPFDYRTITDVILNLSYTAEEDDLLRQQVESQNAGLAGSLLNHLTTSSLSRVFSLRQEFSSAFHRLIQAPAGTPVTIELGERHFPLFLQGRALTAAGADLVLVVGDRTVDPGAASISVNGAAASGFPAPTDPPAPGEAYGGLPARPIDAAFAAGLQRQHTLVVEDPGGLAPAAGGGALDPDRVSDLLLVVAYRLS